MLPWILDFPNGIMIEKFTEYYNRTRGMVGSGILVYIIAIESTNNKTLGSRFERDLDKQKNGLTKNWADIGR